MNARSLSSGLIDILKQHFSLSLLLFFIGRIYVR